MAVAVAIALALHEILAGLLPRTATPPKEEPERVEHVTLARIQRTPTPTPSPTPKPPRRLQVSRNLTVVSATPMPVAAPVGKAATASPVKRNAAARPKPPVLHTRAVTSLPVGAQGAGAGNASGAGSLGNGQSGSGTGKQGNGSGGGGAPCGAVDFSATGQAHFNQQSGFYERDNIVAVVHYADGHSDEIPLDWTWRFKTESLDPFANSDVPMFFQSPPKAQRASEPQAVQYIMQYSGAGGETKLKDDCPNIPPPTTPHPWPA